MGKASSLMRSSVFDRLLKIEVVSWEWKAGAAPPGEERKRVLGVLAQQVEKLFPELVVNAGGYRKVEYSGLAALAVVGLQHLHAESEELRARVDRLARQVEKLSPTPRATRRSREGRRVARKS